MSKQLTIEDCGAGPKPCVSQRNRTTITNVLAADAANNIADAQQADLAVVLSELLSSRTTVSSIDTKISAVDGFGTKLDNVEKRITQMNGSVDAMQRGFADLKADIIANDKQLTEAEDRIGTAEDDMERVKLQLTDAVKRIAYLESKTEDLENPGRRKNLRLVGLPESAEKTRPVVEFIQHMLPIWLGLDTSRPFVLERAHRTLAKPRLGQSRAVIIRFSLFQAREFVFQTAKKREITHENHKIFFAQDFSAETMKTRSPFNAVKKKFIEAGSFRGFQLHPCKMRILHKG
ncbi:uncharacterized protein LOC111579457 [Tachysurus ichikawai]